MSTPNDAFCLAVLANAKALSTLAPLWVVVAKSRAEYQMFVTDQTMARVHKLDRERMGWDCVCYFDGEEGQP